MGPIIEDSLTASPQSPKNSARRGIGLKYATNARPADCDAPKHNPAMLAANQNIVWSCAPQASKTIIIQPIRVSAIVGI